MGVQASTSNRRQGECDRKSSKIYKPSVASNKGKPANARPSLVSTVATTAAARTPFVTVPTSMNSTDGEVRAKPYSTDNPLYHGFAPSSSSTTPGTAPSLCGTASKPSLGVRLKVREDRRKRKSPAGSTTPEDDEGSGEFFLPYPTGKKNDSCKPSSDVDDQASEHEYMNPRETGAAQKLSFRDWTAFCWTASLLVLVIVLVAMAVLVVSQLVHKMLRSEGRDTQGSLPCATLASSQAGQSQQQQLPEDAAFCLPCLDVYLTSLEVRQNRGKFRQEPVSGSDSMLCCVESHDDLQGILKEYVHVRYRTSRANGQRLVPGNPGEDSPDQHLVLAYDAKSRPEVKNDSYKIPLTPVTSHKSHHPQDSFLLQNGQLLVKRESHYFMYSDVPFNYSFVHSPSSNSDKVAYPALKQKVMKVRNGGEVIALLENSVLPCDLQSNQRSCRMHSFASGTFWLSAGDSIFLQVSDYSSLIKDEVRFGLHPI